jgi:hypothetical protein
MACCKSLSVVLSQFVWSAVCLIDLIVERQWRFFVICADDSETKARSVPKLDCSPRGLPVLSEIGVQTRRMIALLGENKPN